MKARKPSLEEENGTSDEEVEENLNNFIAGDGTDEREGSQALESEAATPAADETQRMADAMNIDLEHED
jgi:hypothetical protein